MQLALNPTQRLHDPALEAMDTAIHLKRWRPCDRLRLVPVITEDACRVHPAERGGEAVGHLQSVLDRVEEIAQSPELAIPANFHLEPRCRICRNDGIRRKVNDLLTAGASYAMIVRVLHDDNAVLDHRDKITIDSVRNHCSRHFPVQNAAKATYRQILEQRAQENGVDFVNAVATAITPLAFLETVMAKSYAALVDPDTTVDVKTGILAADRLQALIDSRAAGANLMEIKFQVHQIAEAVRTTVPEAMWTQILEKLPGMGKRPNDALADENDDDDEAFDPGDDPLNVDDFGGR